MSEHPSQVVVLPDDFGVLVHGTSDAVDAVIDRLVKDAGLVPASRDRMALCDVAGVAATGAALAATSGEYLRLTAESVGKLKALGLPFEGAGVARNSAGQVAAHLSFEPISLAAEQALALQTAAVSLALRSAIADVQKAVERVEGKVDDIHTTLVGRVKGDVIGTYRELDRVVAATNKNGFLLPEDWQGVSSARLKISQDLESMRTFIHEQAKKLNADESVPKREARLKKFVTKSGHVADVLSLIVVAEKSLQLYEYLKIQAVHARDPELVGNLLAEARAALTMQRLRDEELVQVLRGGIAQARVIEALEVHRVFSKRDLDKHARNLHERVLEFAEASVLESPAVLGKMPEASWSDARREIRDRTEETGRAVKELGSSVLESGTKSAAKQARKARKRIKDQF